MTRGAMLGILTMGRGRRRKRSFGGAVPLHIGLEILVAQWRELSHFLFFLSFFLFSLSQPFVSLYFTSVEMNGTLIPFSFLFFFYVPFPITF